MASARQVALNTGQIGIAALDTHSGKRFVFLPVVLKDLLMPIYRHRVRPERRAHLGAMSRSMEFPPLLLCAASSACRQK
jgi:hypothetical protein